MRDSLIWDLRSLSFVRTLCYSYTSWEGVGLSGLNQGGHVVHEVVVALMLLEFVQEGRAF